MSFGNFGAKPRGMNNPVYWVNQHLQNQRRDNSRRAAVDKFNERWHRLEGIDLHLKKYFIEPLYGHEAERKIVENLQKSRSRAASLHSAIAQNINSCAVSELSKYATSLKNMALISVGMCMNMKIYEDILSFEYKSSEKIFLINGNQIYYFG